MINNYTKINTSRYVSYVGAALLLGVGITGCVSMPNPAGKPLATQTFTHIEPISINVFKRDIQIQPITRNSSASFAHPVDEMITTYLRQKLKPEGDTGTIVASVDELIIDEKAGNATNKAANKLKIGRYDTYTVSVKLRLEKLDDLGNVTYGKVINASRQINISEHASIATRERKQLEGLEQLFLTLDAHVNTVIKQEMSL